MKVSGHKDPRLAEDNGADGLTVDSDGRVYVATNLGVEVFSARGEHLGVIPIGIWGGEQNMLSKPANLTFSGPDKKTLYTVGSGAIYPWSCWRRVSRAGGSRFRLARTTR